MGGFGSGRRGGRPTVDSSFTLDISYLLSHRGIVPGKYGCGSWIWTRVQTGGQIGWISYESNMLEASRSWLQLTYTLTSRSDGSKLHRDYRVRLDTTQPHFGGVRWWFICQLPGRRAAKLHLPNGASGFASREAYQLPYRSQRQDETDRSHERLARIVGKLGGEYRSPDMPPPSRPTWMRRTT
jgi:hypothetical protein